MHILHIIFNIIVTLSLLFVTGTLLIGASASDETGTHGIDPMLAVVLIVLLLICVGVWLI